MKVYVVVELFYWITGKFLFLRERETGKLFITYGKTLKDCRKNMKEVTEDEFFRYMKFFCERMD